MKKLAVLLLLTVTTVTFAQQKVDIKLNLNQGDSYKLVSKQVVDSKMMGSDVTTEMSLNIKQVSDTTVTTVTSIDKMVMNMMQGGMAMSYDSSSNPEDLDDMGKMLKQQVDPQLQLEITSTTSKKGKLIDMKIMPETMAAMAEQFKNLNATALPEQLVGVGDSWESNATIQGIDTKQTFTLKEILKDKYVITIKGAMTGVATGDITGTMALDKTTGMTLSSNVETKMKAQGQDVTIKATTTMTKL